MKFHNCSVFFSYSTAEHYPYFPILSHRVHISKDGWTANTAQGRITVLHSQSQKAQTVSRSVSREIVVAQASGRREITFQQTYHLLSDRNSDHSEFEVNQAIQRPRGERARCDPTDFAEHQKGGPRSLVQMEFDNRSHRSSTCLSLSEAFQPLPP